MGLSNEEMLALARELPIPDDDPWDTNQFIANLAEQRGRPIHLIPADTANLAGSPCGLWLVRERDDVILHERSTSNYHIGQIIRHEIGHMVLGHHRGYLERPPAENTSALFRNVLPDIRPDAIRAVLGRRDFANEQEREAETFAHLLMIASREKERRGKMMHDVFFRGKDR
ncbi:hypothetical protein P5V93_20205 [Mycobacteroides abscessus subsp. abscessus]|uniref:hypothetical protein n=1 Tax=Mycobacteroides abscessus TaxID=36809 RepID=UPI00092683CC|nr:hypothetical protein [Mycobacteroides abscessus]AWG48588.1 hypothetical protein DDT48_03705 [Mycobacteroides abscessus]MBN7551254.1 hypothetical protein [Mycobacteroides abscessus subsp. abscessus]MDO3096594.1 hypothetical protein [Mycobacteroides abscessus subsp. abscessus]MDO3189316.1 hypothetical protein [Mycobacteroides abscessus subsp. abscessus]MDO3193609.1 hypothetical protein [Mycobacteroides abscessus subsp. abscessus]